jgi:drug/metabolite transporter (DMT)-like permease
MHPDRMTASSLAAAATMLIPIALLTAPPVRTGVQAPALLAVLYLGLLPTALCYLVRYRQVVKHGYTFVANTGYLVPIWSALLGMLLLSEAIRMRVILGLAIIIAGIWLGRRRA